MTKRDPDVMVGCYMYTTQWMRSSKRVYPMSIPHIIIIGAGSTGSATAHDLALRGVRVTVIERGDIASGTTGRTHCLLHSGGRYCVNDPGGGG